MEELNYINEKIKDVKSYIKSLESKKEWFAHEEIIYEQLKEELVILKEIKESLTYSIKN